jgi:hypothetical protein
MANQLFKPRSYAIRDAMMTGRRNGQTLNPPRLPEIGGMNTRNANQRESELTLSKPRDTK